MRVNSFLYIIIGLMLSMTAKTQTVVPADTLLVNKLLKDARQLPHNTNYILHFANTFVGVPYVAHTLEGNITERLVVNLRQMDCTTLVENVVALTNCMKNKKYTYRDFTDALTQLRYRNGKIDGYDSRLHYFTDWILDNSKRGIVKEVQLPNPPFTAVQTISVNYMSSHPQSYSALKNNSSLVRKIKAQEDKLNGKRFRYIPKSEIKNSKVMRQTIKNGDIIAITCNKPGLDIAHLGFAVWSNDGLHLLNASQIHKKVVKEPMTLDQYLQKHPSHTGIRIIRVEN